MNSRIYIGEMKDAIGPGHGAFAIRCKSNNDTRDARLTWLADSVSVKIIPNESVNLRSGKCSTQPGVDALSTICISQRNRSAMRCWIHVAIELIIAALILWAENDVRRRLELHAVRTQRQREE